MPPPPATALFDQLARGWRGYALIALIALTAGLFGVGSLPPMDIDESRFMQATRQMVETDDYVRIRLQDEERNRKPIAIHWLQAASVHVSDPLTDRLNTIWPYRLPSVLGLVLASLAALWAGAALVGHRTALIGAGLYASGLLAGMEGMTAKTDSVMVGFTTLALAALARLRFSQQAPKLTAVVFWLAMGCGILTKGPITPAVAAVTLIALALWERKAAWMKPLAWWPGPLLMMAITLPWLIAIGVATEGRFYTEMLASELGPKLTGSDPAHQGFPGYYLLLLPLLIFPATYALPAAARLAWDTVRAKRDDDAHAPLRFLIAWAAGTFLIFELMPAKLVHYTLPAYPAIAMLCAAGLAAMRGRRWRTTHPVGAVLFAVFGLLIVAVMAGVATFIPGDAAADLRRAIATALVGAAIVIAAVVGLSVFRRVTARAAILMACGLALSFGLRDQLAPQARGLFVSAEAVDALTRARLMPRENERFWVVGYAQPSLVFLTRTSIKLVRADELGDVQAGDTIMIEGRVLSDTIAALAERGLTFDAADEPVSGIALGRGETTTLHFGTVRAAPNAAAEDRQAQGP
ncbi:MAG: glycosyltransferase family 39 protein [Hyphomonadaceae bacterium]|nr:glycosyltransferase family 39 protein [Hyphomonadaceae bacterium]